MGFNTGTGAPLGRVLPRLRTFLGGNQLWQAPGPAVRQAAGSGWDAATLEARVRPMLDAAVHSELAPFLRTMQRRLARDHTRLHGYYDDLRRESLKRLVRLEGVESAKADVDRHRGLQRFATLASGSRKPATGSRDGLQVTLVAGERNQRYLQALSSRVPLVSRALTAGPTRRGGVARALLQ